MEKKLTLLFVLLIAVTSQHCSQNPTTKLPEGVMIKDGKIYLEKEFDFIESNDKETVVVAKKKDGEVSPSGGFACRCGELACNYEITERSINCLKNGSCQCYMVIVKLPATEGITVGYSSKILKGKQWEPLDPNLLSSDVRQ